MELYTESNLEKRLNDTADRLIGTRDKTLNTIYKLSLMEEHGLMTKNQIDEIILNLKNNIIKDNDILFSNYELTYDTCGNLIPLNSIEYGARKESEKDFETVVLESE